MIDVRVGPALDTVRSLDATFEFVFIDADKPSYLDYYEATLPLLAPGGLIAVDNVFQGGRVINEHAQGNPAHMRRFNDHVSADKRVEAVMVPIRDGVTLVRRI